MFFSVISQVLFNGCNKVSEMYFARKIEPLVSLFALQTMSVEGSQPVLFYHPLDTSCIFTSHSLVAHRIPRFRLRILDPLHEIRVYIEWRATAQIFFHTSSSALIGVEPQVFTCMYRSGSRNSAE